MLIGDNTFITFMNTEIRKPNIDLLYVICSIILYVYLVCTTLRVTCRDKCIIGENNNNYYIDGISFNG